METGHSGLASDDKEFVAASPQFVTDHLLTSNHQLRPTSSYDHFLPHVE